MQSLLQKQMKSFWAILATATGTASVMAATLGISSSALASESVFNCSAKSVIVEVSRLGNGTLRYKAYNIPTNLQHPNLVLNGGTVEKNSKGETLYRFRNQNYRYVAVKDQGSGYGRVLVYKNNQIIAKNYCGDV